MKQYAVIGLGLFGYSVAIELSRLGNEVLAIDKNEEIVDKIAENVSHAVVCDVTSEGALMELGLSNFDCCIVCIGNNFEALVLAAMTCKELGVKQVIAKAKDEMHGRVLTKAGVDQVFIPEKEMGTRLASLLCNNGIVDFIELSRDYSIVEIKTPDKWIGLSILDLRIREKFGVNIVAIKNNNEQININPRPEEILEKILAWLL